MIRLYVGLAVTAALGACVWYYGDARYKTGASDTHALYAERDAEAADLQRKQADIRVRENRGIDNATVNRSIAAARAAASDRAQLGELRDALASRSDPGGDTAPAGCADERAAVVRLEGLVRESAELLVEGNSRGTELETQAAGLQEYVAAVCTVPLVSQK